MFDTAGLVARGQHKHKLQHATASQRVATLLDELRRSNLQVMPLSRTGRTVGGGIPCMVSVGKVLSSPFEAGRLKLALRHFMLSDAPVTLSLTELSADGCATNSLQKFCEYLCSVLSPLNYEPGNLGLSLHSHQIPLQSYFLIANSVLGSGPRYVYLDGLQMRRHCNSAVQSETDRNWRFLWQHRHQAEQLLPVYGGLVRSACPLLSDEIAGSILPGTGTVVPPGSAWLPVEIPLTKFMHAGGHLDWSRLSPAIARAVCTSEDLLNYLSWPCRRQRTDAWLHRRLAISVTGLGDLVLRCGRDPGVLDCLAWLTGIVKRIRNEMQAASIALARQSGALPAVLRTDPSTGLKAGPARDNWRMCWNSAVQTSALRHRNLLVLSPYSVLPDEANHSVKFFDLLPVIRHADAWCFSTTASTARWSIVDYQRFHRRAWAVIQGHNEGCVVADGV